MNITKAWQSKFSWTVLLLPLSFIFYFLISFRKLLFLLKVKKSYRPKVPLIVVGNISVGGTGKTPTVIWLCKFLQNAGYRPVIISRGYGGNSEQYPLVVDANSNPQESGDEPLLLAIRTACPVVVDPIRCRAAQMAENIGCDIIISDDGLQHYALERDLELIVIDGQRRFGNGFLLPAGGLREPKSRLKTAFAKICNGGIAQENEWQMTLKPAAHWQNVFEKNKSVTKDFFEGKKLLAIAGIGNPQRFFALLTELNIQAEVLPLADHAEIQIDQFTKWQNNYDMILMTEKDAVKCRKFKSSNCFYLPVTAQIDDKLELEILQKIKELNKYG